jgi:rubrerythrin
MKAHSDVEPALAVIRHAIHNEISGQRFYNDAAYHCIDLWAKEIFADLAQEEEGHTRLLLVEYESLSTTGAWIDPQVAMDSSADVDITRFTFAGDAGGQDLFPVEQSVDEAVDRRSDDLAALAFGVQMEEEALALYGREARTAQDPAAQKAYQFLIEEETRHHQQLKEQWERLAGRAFPED